MWNDPFYPMVPSRPIGRPASIPMRPVGGEFWGQWDSHYGPVQRRPVTRRHQTNVMFGPLSASASFHHPTAVSEFYQPVVDDFSPFPTTATQASSVLSTSSAVAKRQSAPSSSSSSSSGGGSASVGVYDSASLALKRVTSISAAVNPPLKLPKSGGAPLYYDFNAPAKPSTLTIRCAVQSIKCDYQWNTPKVNKGQTFIYKVRISGSFKGDIVIDFPSWKTSSSVDLEPGNWYTLTVEAIASGSRVLAAGEIQFKSILCAAEMVSLQAKAVSFLQTSHGSNQMQEIVIFYRNKPPDYWLKIQQFDGIMHPYLKDQCGNPGSPINGEIDGLFFAARLQNGGLPTTSPFGGQRLKLFCHKLFTPETHHMYFGDFYCNTYVHYVTVVICIKDTPVDQFCRDKLDLLDPFNNLLLKLSVDSYGNYRYFINNNVWVEVYYTGDVPLWWGEFDYTVSLGQSKPNGIPNNKYCKVCNLYPLEPTAEEKLAMEKAAMEKVTKMVSSKKRPLASDGDEKLNKKSRHNWLTYEFSPFFELNEKLPTGSLSPTSTFHLAMEIARNISADHLDEFLPHVIDTICDVVNKTSSSSSSNYYSSTKLDDYFNDDDHHHHHHHQRNNDGDKQQQQQLCLSSRTSPLDESTNKTFKIEYPAPGPAVLNETDEREFINKILTKFGRNDENNRCCYTFKLDGSEILLKKNQTINQKSPEHQKLKAKQDNVVKDIKLLASPSSRRQKRELSYLSMNGADIDNRVRRLTDGLQQLKTHLSNLEKRLLLLT